MKAKIKQIRKPSKIVTCEICGKSVFKRGIVSHIRMQHGLKLVETTKVIDSVTEVNLKNTQVKQTIEVIKEYKQVHVYDPVEARRTYLAMNKIAYCCRCGRDVKVADINQATFYRIRKKIACESCIHSFYILPEIVYAIKATTYDSNGDTIASRTK